MIEHGKAGGGGQSLDLNREFEGHVAQSDFRNAMASLAANVCVVAAQSGSERLGRTVTAVFSLTVDPPAVLVSIDASSALAGMIRTCKGFSLAVLAETQAAVADAFAGKEIAERRFNHGDWRDWSSGHPRLGGAVAAMDCAVIGEVEMAGHILFVGGPHQIDLDETRASLVWHHRQYNAVRPL